MKPFVRVSGIAAPMPSANINTDVIMPKQFLKGIDRTGLERGLFHDLRFDGEYERPDFILNRRKSRNACFLIVGPNFGCGSSREHAVWGLMQFGIRALIGTSFASIFQDNCCRNGLLALCLPERRVAELLRKAGGDGLDLTVDLQRCQLEYEDCRLDFEVEPELRQQLLDGQDAIGLTLSWQDEIIAFQERHHTSQPWLE
uniref:3-isopropylmalate dehydratase small subunit n=1 Tax=Brucella pseudintermedia TaxID=370111 RepID=UPI00158E71D8|nr:3-isopropylmalate dehydratase small subunit [Brucella pseudintermedia]